MASWKNQCRSTNACRSQQQATWHRDLHRRLSHKGPVWLGFTVKQGGRTVHEDSGAHRVTTSSLTMEVEAVIHAIQWLASQRDARIAHAIILTDSMNLLQKVESGMGCPDWHTAMHSLRLQRLLWIYCPNERADRLARTADTTSGLQLGRAEGAQRLEELSQHGQARTSQHWQPEGKRSGEKKRPTFHPPKSRTICDQPGKYWHCFEGNLGETAKRRGAYGPFRALRCHLELKLKLKLLGQTDFIHKSQYLLLLLVYLIL